MMIRFELKMLYNAKCDGKMIINSK